MSLIPLGILAASGAGGGSSYESIASATGTGSSGTITFSSIPSTYKHLQIRGITRNTNAATTSNSLRINFNGDISSSNYAFHTLNGDGSNDNAAGTSGFSYIQAVGVVPQNNATANLVGAVIIDIHDYASTTKNKTVRIFGGSDSNAADTTYKVNLASGLWVDTSAINSISIVSASASWETQTTFALYGIKG
jgi:hypothetical protein